MRLQTGSFAKITLINCRLVGGPLIVDFAFMGHSQDPIWFPFNVRLLIPAIPSSGIYVLAGWQDGGLTMQSRAKTAVKGKT